MAGINRVYWDSCIFLAHLKAEPKDPAQMAKVADMVLEFSAGKVGIVTSAIYTMEVLEGTLSADQITQLRRLTLHSNFSIIDVNTEVCRVAAEIRNYYKLNPVDPLNPNRVPSTPDCIHVASAIAASAISEQSIPLWTFDTNPKTRECAMTALSGMVCGKYMQEITTPK